MYIKMENDKSLVITVPTTIYRGESRADLITFLIPDKYEGRNLADCSVVMKYILPDGSGRSEALNVVPEMYKSYYQYSTVANTRLTKFEGDITIWLTMLDYSDTAVLKTGEVSVTISPSKDITDYMSDEDLDQLDQLTARVNLLEKTKADDIVFHEEDSTIQLLSNGVEIGRRVAISATVAGVYVTDVTLSNDGELLVTLSDGNVENLGVVTCDGTYVYVPHVDDRNILTFTIEEGVGEIPDPVDLNPHDEWSDISESEVETDYIWEEM